MRYSQRHILPHSTLRTVPCRPPRAVVAMRALVLMLIMLLLIFVVLMHVTGGYHVGGPVLGSILLIGFGATNYAR